MNESVTELVGIVANHTTNYLRNVLNGNQAGVYLRMAEAAAREVRTQVAPKKGVKLLGSFLHGAKEWGPLFLRCAPDKIDWAEVEDLLCTSATQRVEAVLAGASEEPEDESEA